MLYFDTHAGRGRHRSGEPGSPLVALRTLLDHNYRDELLRRSEVRFFFIEQESANLDGLNAELEKMGRLPDRVHVTTSAGDAYAVLSNIVQGFESSGQMIAPAFIFVDPFGFPVPTDLLARLMVAGRVELFVNVMWRQLDMAIRQRRPAEHGLATTLDRIFAGDDWRRIDGETVNERMNQTVGLLSDRIGSTWTTYIRMTSGGDAVKYLLLHLTNHDRGRELMKECMWKVAPDGGFEVLQRDDPKQPLLIMPEPDLAPLRAWLLARLRQRPRTRTEIDHEIRQEPWLPAHLRTVVNELRMEHEIETDGSSGKISLASNRQLRLL